MGNNTQGYILDGQVQGVKQGEGVLINPDGTINFDPTGLNSVVRTNNNDDAYNEYIWPSPFTIEAGTFLSINASSELSWNPPSIGSVVTVGGLQPTPARVGRLWFDPATYLLKVYENLDGTGKWTPVSQGNTVDPDNVSADPTWVEGNGTASTPYVIPDIILTVGGMSRSSSVIRVVGLAPYQHVPMVDVEAEANGYRFYPSNTFADENGQLEFLIYFNDIPRSTPDQVYSATFKLGFDECYISVHTDIANPLVLDGPGTISVPGGNPNVGDILDYTPGTASGGIPPISYTWVWKKQSDGSIVQTDGQTLVIPAGLANDRVFVELTATDSSLSSVTTNTTGYPLSPDLIGRGDFPNTNIAFPSSIPQEVSTLWADEGTDLSASGCIEFKVGAGSFSQGPATIANGDTITTRWNTSPSCGGASNGTTITGCVFSSTYQECASLTLDRIPSPFSFVPVSAIIPGNVGTSQVIVPMGYNATAYVTYTGTSTASTIEASINGDPFVAIPIFGTNTLEINPGETLTIRATTGLTPSTSYVANINIGEGASVQSGSFTLNTSASSNFSTPIPFPTTTIDVPTAVTWLAGDGATTLTSTDCIEFSVNAGAFSQGPTPITTGDTITTRWATGGSCGGAAHGATITGTVTDVPASGTKTSFASLTIDRVPTSFSFTDLTNQSTNTLVTSNVLNIVGTNAPAYITYAAPPSGGSLTSVEASVGGGAWTAIPSSGTTLPINPVASGPGVTLQIRGITGASTATSYGVSIVIGEGTSIQQDVWTATTTSVIPTLSTPSIISPVNGATGLTPYAVNPPGITITASAYTPLNGASATHQSTDWEIRSGSNSGPVVFSGNSLTQLTSYFLDATLINPSTSYFVRCRYYSGDVVPVVSNWSPWSQFNTATTFSLTWVKRYSSPGGSANDTPWCQNAATWIGASTNRFVLVGRAGQNSRYSSDGIVWTGGPVISSGNDLYAVTPGFGTYANTLVAVGENGVVRQSTNGGVSWNTPVGSLNSSALFYSIACDPSGRFVAGGENGVLRTTTDLGTTWTNVSGASVDVQSITWDSVGSQFIAACSNQSDNDPPWTSNRLVTSPDGLTWTTLTPVIVHAGGGANDPAVFNFKVMRVGVIPGPPTLYFLFPTWSDGPFSRYAVSTNLVNWDEYQAIITPAGQYVGNGVIGGNFIVTGWDNYYSALANSIPPYTFNKDLDTTNDYLRCAAYSPLLNRFVIGNNNGDILSTS